jgi:hypothetical protein
VHGARGTLCYREIFFKCVDYVSERAFKLPHVHPLENANDSVTLCSREGPNILVNAASCNNELDIVSSTV